MDVIVAEENTIGPSSLQTNSWREVNTLSPLSLSSMSWHRLWWRSSRFFKDSFQSLNVIRKQRRAPPSVGTANSHPHSYLFLHMHARTQTDRYPDFLLDTVFYEQHAILLATYTDTYRNEKSNSWNMTPMWSYYAMEIVVMKMSLF